MKTKAVRIYGVNDLRLEEFELPEIGDDEVLAHIVSDSLCMSSHKAAMQGPAHKRIPDDCDVNPIILGHEFCGDIVKVGKNWQHKFTPGEKFTIQPAHNKNGSLMAPGYSYKYCGGGATYVIIPADTLEMDCLLKYSGDAYFYGSLSEPMSCIIGGCHANYHTKGGSYVHDMGIKEGGAAAVLAGAGPMGLGAVDYMINCDRRPSLLIVTDIDQARLDRAAEVLPVEKAAKNGVKLMYLNTGNVENPVEYLKSFAPEGFNDVFVYAPVKPVVEMGDAILAKDGCLNFFAGPTKTDFSAMFNFYNVHYASTHIVGTSGGNTDDMREAVAMMEKGLINPAAMITHICGLDAVPDATINLDKIPGGKKLCYTNISLPMSAIADFEELGKTDPMFRELDRICKANNGLWCAEAEKYLLANAKSI